MDSSGCAYTVMGTEALLMLRMVRHWCFFGGSGGKVVGRGGGEGDFRGTYKSLLYTGPEMVEDASSSSDDEQSEFCNARYEK